MLLVGLVLQVGLGCEFLVAHIALMFLHVMVDCGHMSARRSFSVFPQI